MRIQRVYWPFIILLLISSCKDSPLDIDVSGVEIEFTAKRFDKALFSSDYSDWQSLNQDLYQTYGEFWPNYQEVVLQLGPAGDSATLAECHRFVSDPTVQEIQTAIEKVHDPLIKEYNSALQDAFKHYRYYFDNPVPEIYYYNSGFNFGIFPMDSCMGIGLDFFLGSDHEIIQKVPLEVFPQYRKRKMDPQYLVTDAMRGWLVVSNQQKMDFKDLQSQIIDFGKVLYTLDACMPNTPDSLKMNYTSAQQDWVERNEERVWQEIAKDDVLFQTQSFEVSKWVSDGPFTSAPGIPQDSPPQLGIWIGWQVVRDYMAENPEVTINQLWEEKNYSKILRFYRPG
ncbi:MAG: hypothetical protein HKN32_10280 [Flavobacteriales bacterium]|nr:hypothetical protein [Flavobacteriales bacterium]